MRLRSRQQPRSHPGQLWQGLLSGGSTQYQYLYCGSNSHLLTGLYPLGTSCTNLTGAVYTSNYDAWGNVTSRTYSDITATLSYDTLDHFTEWNAGSTNREWYLYDAAGNRVLRRTINSSSTTMRVYAFGQEEHTYGSAGANLSNTYYYTLGGRLLGALDGNGTTFYLTDALGSVLASFNTPAGSAVVKGNQVFGPYGTARDVQGTINTAKGFTGQYNDSLTGLDYYNARYYDPRVGMFLSADSKQGNLQGMNPYGYVGGNPETYNDPTGQMFAPPRGGGGDPFGNSLVPYNPPTQPGTGGTPPSSGKNPLSDGITSCGTPGPSQPLCGDFWAQFAVYLPFGGQIGLPGGWCIECGFGGGSNDGGESGGIRDLTSDFASDTGGASSKLNEALLDDPYLLQKAEDELTFEHPDIETAFASMVKHLEQTGGRLLSNDLVETTARVDPEGYGIKGLINGYAERNGERRWRLDFDSTKGLHFNWEDYTLGKKTTGLARWGVEKFPGTSDDFLTLLLQLNEGGIGEMLAS